MYFLCNMTVNFLIVGQGIAGTLLSRELMNAGCRVMVVDDGNVFASSRVAGGLVNPVTGKRLVRSWMIDELLPFANSVYTKIGEEFGINVARESFIVDMFATKEQSELFDERIAEEQDYLSKPGIDSHNDHFRYSYGSGCIFPSLIVNLEALLTNWRDHLADKESLWERRFSFDECVVDENGVSYNGVRAEKIIFCDGAASMNNPLFSKLPWTHDKGEALVADIPGLPANCVYKQGNVSIVPWRNGLFWIGALHDWKYTSLEPSAKFRKDVETLLDYWLKLPYKITDHLVSVRPANVERKPFVGVHPLYDRVAILNGLGGKGFSLAPYFAHMLADNLVHNIPVEADVDVGRFRKTLSR